MNEEKVSAISGDGFQNCLKKNQRKDGSALSIIILSVCELLFLIWPQLLKRKVMLSSGRNNWHSFPNTYSFESDLSDGARYSHHH